MHVEVKDNGDVHMEERDASGSVATLTAILQKADIPYSSSGKDGWTNVVVSSQFQRRLEQVMGEVRVFADDIYRRI